jgi:hypothetical protein
VLRVIAGAGIAAITCAAAQADSMYDRYFGQRDKGMPCYARNYDAAHLKKHPKQSVQRIEIDYDVKEGDTDRPNTANYFEIGFGFMLKHSRKWNGDAAYCKTANGFFDCYLDADGGLFHLTPQGDGLRLDVVNRGGTGKNGNQINVEGSGDEDSVGFGTPGGDDLSFLLPHAERAVCDAATSTSGY